MFTSHEMSKVTSPITLHFNLSIVIANIPYLNLLLYEKTKKAEGNMLSHWRYYQPSHPSLHRLLIHVFCMQPAIFCKFLLDTKNGTKSCHI